MLGQLQDACFALMGQILVGVRDIGHRLYAWDVAVAGKDRLTDDPSHTRGAVARGLNGAGSGVAIQGQHLAVGNDVHILGVQQSERVTIVPGEIEFVAQQRFPARSIGIDPCVGKYREQLVQAVDVVKVGVGEQHAAQAALDEREDAVNVATVDEP